MLASDFSISGLGFNVAQTIAGIFRTLIKTAKKWASYLLS